MYVDIKTMREVSMGNPDITSRFFKDMRRLKTVRFSYMTTWPVSGGRSLRSCVATVTLPGIGSYLTGFSLLRRAWNASVN